MLSWLKGIRIVEEHIELYHVKVQLGPSSLHIPLMKDSQVLVNSETIQLFERLLNESVNQCNQQVVHLLSSYPSLKASLFELQPIQSSWKFIIEPSESNHVLMRCQHSSCHSIYTYHI